MQEKEEKQHTKKDIYKILMLANFLKIDLQLHKAVAFQYQNKFELLWHRSQEAEWHSPGYMAWTRKDGRHSPQVAKKTAKPKGWELFPQDSNFTAGTTCLLTFARNIYFSFKNQESTRRKATVTLSAQFEQKPQL